MPKIKTHRAAAKRFKKTGSGKIMRRYAFHSHILTKKSAKRKRHLRGEVEVASGNMGALKLMLPYAK